MTQLSGGCVALYVHTSVAQKGLLVRDSEVKTSRSVHAEFVGAQTTSGISDELITRI